MCAFSVPDLDSAARDQRKLKVLVVDDYIDAAETLADFVSLSGHHALTAHDGATALRLADRTRPDVILMELTLPTISGLDVCRRVRSAHWGKQPKILAVTGWGGPSRVSQSRDAGFDGHLLKPIDCRELECLLEQLARSRSEQSPRQGAFAPARVRNTEAPLPLLR